MSLNSNFKLDCLKRSPPETAIDFVIISSAVKVFGLDSLPDLTEFEFSFLQLDNKTTSKKAKFQYEISDKYTAGIVLTGTEIKSIRSSKASIAESFCEFNDRGELFVINMTVEEYKYGTYYNHRPKAERKLLLNKKELKKLKKEMDVKGNAIIPLKLFLNDRGLAKLIIGLGKGKKLYDKRETIKDRDNKRNLDRIKKDFR